MASDSLIKALLEPRAYPHEVTAVSLVETHISWVLLTGKYAYKIKKPVNFGFLDFSTLAQRRFFCHEELRLNRRLAADLYLDVVPITGTLARPVMGGAGEAIEHAVKMIQFPASCTLSGRAEGGQLGNAEIGQIADIIATFHGHIARTDASSSYGDSADIRHWFAENFAAIRPLLTDTHHKRQLKALQDWGEDAGHKLAGLMQQRKCQGYVRECHGDLHLSNMTLINGKVTLFDCIEFNPKLRWIDVLSEVAFLFVDLLHFGYESLAYRLLNHYLQHTGDYFSLALLRYYLVYRALVCAKVVLLRKSQQDHTTLADNYTGFAALAGRFTSVGRVALIITHGVSGSGKSTIACSVAEKIGAVHIRSDVERKRLFGYQAQAPTDSGLNAGLYSVAAGHKTYMHLANAAKTVLVAGFSVIVDATFLKIEQRELFRQLAVACNVALLIIDVEASDEALKKRIQQRQNDASEATIEVLQQQRQSAQPLSPEERGEAVSVDTETGKGWDELLNTIADYTLEWP